MAARGDQKTLLFSVFPLPKERIKNCTRAEGAAKALLRAVPYSLLVRTERSILHTQFLELV